MPKDTRWPTCLHESGHFALAWLFGWRLGLLTVEPGPAANGCAEVESLVQVDWASISGRSLRYVFMPADIRLELEQRVMVAQAGKVAEYVLLEDARDPALPSHPYCPPAGRPVIGSRPAPQSAGDEPPAEAPAEVPAPLRAEAAAMVNDETAEDDWKVVRRFAVIAHCEDRKAAATWTAALSAQAAPLILDMKREVVRLADRLYAVGVIDGETAASVLSGSTEFR